MMINVLIIDPLRSNRQKIKQFLEEFRSDFKLIGEASTPTQAERIMDARQPDLIISEDQNTELTGLQLFNNHQQEMTSLHAILYTDNTRFSHSKETMADGRLEYLQKPLRKNDLTNSFRKMLLKIETIQSSTIKVMNQRTQYESQLELFKERFLMNLIYGSVRDTPYILGQMVYFGIPYSQSYSVAVFKIDDFRRYRLALEEDEQQFMMFRLWSIIQAAMEKDQGGIAFISRYDEVTMLYTAIDEQIDVIEHAMATHEQIKETMSLQGTIGIGRAYSDPRLLHHSYNQAIDAILEHDYLGKDTVIHIDYVIGKNDLAYLYSQEQEYMLCRYAISGQLKDALKSLGKILTTMDAAEDYSCQLYQAFTQSLLSRLFRDGLAYGYQLEKILKEKLSEAMTDSVQDNVTTYSYLEKALTFITDYVKDKKVEQDQALLENALKYVQAYYTSRISLTSAAQYLMTTPRHLESIIYSVYEKSFYDFCMMVRIENAKDLMSRSRMNTGEVASAVGFTNNEYFIAIFKQYTKMTPAEYRHQNKNTSEPPIQLIRPKAYKKYFM